MKALMRATTQKNRVCCTTPQSLLFLWCHNDAEARCSSCILVLHNCLSLARCVACTIPQPWQLQSFVTLSSYQFLGLSLALLPSTLPCRKLYQDYIRRQLSPTVVHSDDMTEISQSFFLDSFYNILCDTEVCSDVLIFIWSLLETFKIRRRQPISKTVNFLFISAVNVQVSEL